MKPESLEPIFFAVDDGNWDWRYRLPVPGKNRTWDVLISRRRWDMSGRAEVYLWRCTCQGQLTGESLTKGTYEVSRDVALRAAIAYIADCETQTM